MSDERGQALLLACLMLFAIAGAVLMTAKIGIGVADRIELQNRADAEAFALATFEARAFNEYAYANRAQASLYVSAMVWQSTNSFLYFTEAFLTDVYGVLRTLNPCAAESKGAVCSLLGALPYVGPIVRALSWLTGMYRSLLLLYQNALAALDPDAIIGREIIPALRQRNSELAASSIAQMKSTLARLDPPMACLFERAHQRAALGSDPFTPLDPTKLEESDPTARAKRSMAQIANAARPEWVTRRTLQSFAPPAWFAPLRPLVVDVPKLGQTRLLSFRHARGFPDSGASPDDRPNNLRQYRQITHHPIGVLGQGDALGADDTYRLRLGPLTWGEQEDDPLDQLRTSVWSMSQSDLREGGIHWRLVRPGTAPNAADREVGLNRSKSCLGKVCVEVFGANVRVDPSDHNHSWGGLLPFVHFEPGRYEEGCIDPSLSAAATHADGFNQPSTWSLQRKGRLTAVARAQVYYHRPGNWTEQPNFFSPYWRPRLARAAQGAADYPPLQAVLEATGFPAQELLH
ncbi:MAG: hypothetical protein ACT4TC_14000 [Myxococcaceae bacterium]